MQGCIHPVLQLGGDIISGDAWIAFGQTFCVTPSCPLATETRSQYFYVGIFKELKHHHLLLTPTKTENVKHMCFLRIQLIN